MRGAEANETADVVFTVAPLNNWGVDCAEAKVGS